MYIVLESVAESDTINKLTERIDPPNRGYVRASTLVFNPIVSDTRTLQPRREDYLDST